MEKIWSSPANEQPISVGFEAGLGVTQREVTVDPSFGIRTRHLKVCLFIGKFSLHKRQNILYRHVARWANKLCFELCRSTLCWSDWLIWPVYHHHVVIDRWFIQSANQFFRPFPKVLQQKVPRWICWANANQSIWRSQVSGSLHLNEKRHLATSSESLCICTIWCVCVC